MFWCICAGIVIILIGLFIHLKPDLVWKMTEEWKSYGAHEPSDLYLKGTKLGGLLYVLLGVIMIILPIILE